MTPDEFIAEWRNDSSAISAHTSGSTGTPKEVAIPKSMAEESAWRTIRFFSLDASSVLYSCVSPDYIGGKMMLVRAECLGTRCICETPSNRPQLNSPKAIDLLAVVPSQMLHILEHKDELPPIRNIIIGGAPLSEAMRTRITDAGFDAWETYGMTETASHVALRKTDEPCFKLLPGIKAGMLDDGRFRIKMPHGLEVTTNDLCRFTSPDTFVVLGRADDAIITGGKKVHPAMLEEKLRGVIGDVEFFITSLPDEKWGHKVVLASTRELMAEEKEAVEAACEPHEKPKEYIVMPELPRTPNGKLIRKLNP